MLAGTVRRGGRSNSQLESLGLDHNQSSRWQKLANIDDDTVFGYVGECG